MDLLEILKGAIRSGCYVYGSYNERYIPNKPAYQKKNYMHDFLLIGCDDEKFISVGYVTDGSFQKYEIPNQNLMDGLYGTSGIKINLGFYRYKTGVVPIPDTKRLIENLQKYISSAKDVDCPPPSGNSVGISSNVRLKEFFLDEVKNMGKAYLDRRYSRVLFEHKWILTQLVQLFLEGDERTKFQACADRNFERAKLIHMLGLKMSYTGKAELIDRVAGVMDEIVAEELRYIPPLIEVLQNQYPS